MSQPAATCVLHVFFFLSFFSVKALEDMKTQWDSFGKEFDNFSSWISVKEKELEKLKSSGLQLEEFISAVKVAV